MDSKKSFVGLGNIVISDIDGTIYINTSSQIRPSVKGALSFYDKDNESVLVGTGKDLFWNVEDARLETSALTAIDIESKTLKVETHADIKEVNSCSLLCDFLKIKTHVEAEKINARDLSCDFLTVDDRLELDQLVSKKWIGFESLTREKTHPFKYQLTLDDGGADVLILKTNDYDETSQSKAVIGFESQRVIIPEAFNMIHRTIETPQGTDKDKKGDIAIDETYIYVCVDDYDGSKHIWKKVRLTEW